jgi:hypothetical protein
MRLAWFAPRSDCGASAHDRAPGTERSAERGRDTAPWDDTGLLIRELRSRHRVELVDAGRAHDFVWRHAREPFDLCIYELGGTPAHQFAAAYAVHYPGVVLLRGLPRHDRALLASRLVVVPHEPGARAIADDCPGTRVRTLVPGVEPLPDDFDDRAGSARPRHDAPADGPAILTALRWPPDGGALAYALSGFAAGRAVLVFDGPETADWPSLDPQTWEPRAPLERLPGWPRQDPICVSIDPRDEAHSLRLAQRRLADDSALRARLGTAAQAWWRTHATVGRAAAAFEALLEEARAVPEPPAPRGVEDGTALARRLLDGAGIAEQRAGLIQ